VISIQPIAFWLSFNLILPSQSNWSLFSGTRQKRRTEPDNRLSFGIGEMTLQMQWAVSPKIPRTHVCGMEWLQLVESIELQVSFAEYSFFYRALWQKRPKI